MVDYLGDDKASAADFNVRCRHCHICGGVYEKASLHDQMAEGRRADIENNLHVGRNPNVARFNLQGHGARVLSIVGPGWGHSGFREDEPTHPKPLTKLNHCEISKPVQSGKPTHWSDSSPEETSSKPWLLLFRLSHPPSRRS